MEITWQENHSHQVGQAGSGRRNQRNQGTTTRDLLTINLLVPFSPSRSCFRAARSSSLASLPFLFPFFPPFFFFFFPERCFFSGSVPPSSPVSGPAGLLWSSSAVGPGLQTDGTETSDRDLGS